jgi:acetyl-CoA C-acetyltransferase
MRQARPVAVLGGVRIPFCRNNTAYADVGNLGMSVRTLGALVEKFGLHGQQLGEVALGAVIKHSSDWNLGREAALSSGLSPLTPGITLQRACGTSLDSIITSPTRSRSGRSSPASAAARTPPRTCRSWYGKKLRRRLLEANRAEDLAGEAGAFRGFHPRELKPEFPGVTEPRTGKSMGEHCEDMAKQWSISRDSQDEWALGSHRKLAAAYERGFLDDLVVSFRGVSRDNILRADSTLEKLATLKPAFDKASGRGTLTAGNSTPLTDGASACLLAARTGRKRTATSAVPAARCAGGRGRLRAWRGPADGADHGGAADARAQRPELQDFDFYEIHEAFAAQVLCTLRPGRARSTAATRLGSWTAPLGGSIRRRSTWSARRWRPGIRSPRPARGSSPPLPRN